jgi:hypothetical protein
MNNSVSFALNRPGYLAKLLKPEDAAILQSLYAQCTEFALLIDGQPPSPTAVLWRRRHKSMADSILFRLLDRNLILWRFSNRFVAKPISKLYFAIALPNLEF